MTRRLPRQLRVLVQPESRESGLGIWAGLLAATAVLIQTGSPSSAVVLWAILLGALLLVSLRFRIGLLALMAVFVTGVVLRQDLHGRAFSDVLTVTQAAIDLALHGGNPYGHGYAESNPPGAPFAYGPLALLWYLPFRIELYRVELGVSILMLIAFAMRGRMLGLALFATLPPLVVTAADGSNDTSAGLLLLIALWLAPRVPWLGALVLAAAVAFKPYGLAWLIPLVGYAGASVVIPFAVGTLVAWGPALLVWGPGTIVQSLRQAEAVHQVPYYSLAYGLGDRLKLPDVTYSMFRFVAGGALALGSIFFSRTARSFVISGAVIFLATLFLGWWSTFAYVAAIAPILCWHIDDWLSLPRVVWPGDPAGLLSAAIDRRWPVRHPSARRERTDAFPHSSDGGSDVSTRTIPT